MKNYPIDKYRFITTGNKIIALTTYAGRTIRGIAKCDPRDGFDMEKGKKLAAARAAVKVAQRRFDRSCLKLVEAEDAVDRAGNHLVKMSRYQDDAYNAMIAAEDAVQALVAEM